MRKRLIILDLLRVVAISLLLFSHLTIYGRHVYRITPLYQATIGGFAVSLFLIISGVSLGVTYFQKKVDYWQFIKKRLWHIYPIYWLSLIIGIGIFIFKNGLSHILWSDVLCSTTGFCAFVGNWGGPYLETAWFIGLIISLYLIFPILLKSIKKYPYPTLFITFIISIVTRYLLVYFISLPTRSLDWLPFAKLFEFSLGIFLAPYLLKPFWQNFGQKISKVIKKILQQTSKLSFPLFLIHYPIVRMPNILMQKFNMPAMMGYFIYFGVIIGLSFLVLMLDFWFKKYYSSLQNIFDNANIR